jgi:uncharacterized protein YodC (DUF2158 family)
VRWAADNVALVLNGTECRLERYGECGGFSIHPAQSGPLQRKSVKYVLTLRGTLRRVRRVRLLATTPFWTFFDARGAHWAVVAPLISWRLALRDEIRVGTTVRPKSGGPYMKVEFVFLNRDGGRVRCTWTDGTKKISKLFDLEEVEQTPEL